MVIWLILWFEWCGLDCDVDHIVFVACVDNSLFVPKGNIPLISNLICDLTWKQTPQINQQMGI